MVYSLNKVFEQSRFTELKQALAAKQQAGETAIFLQEELAVLPNEHWGIVGGWKADVLWMYLSNE